MSSWPSTSLSQRPGSRRSPRTFLKFCLPSPHPNIQKSRRRCLEPTGTTSLRLNLSSPARNSTISRHLLLQRTTRPQSTRRPAPRRASQGLLLAPLRGLAPLQPSQRLWCRPARPQAKHQHPARRLLSTHQRQRQHLWFPTRIPYASPSRPRTRAILRATWTRRSPCRGPRNVSPCRNSPRATSRKRGRKPHPSHRPCRHRASRQSPRHSRTTRRALGTRQSAHPLLALYRRHRVSRRPTLPRSWMRPPRSG
jgi:hypothetical protein